MREKAVLDSEPVTTRQTGTSATTGLGRALAREAGGLVAFEGVDVATS